ncbi:hypothetical protein Daesc_001486 [Daldinia eschscholtzii]|uniref:Uncharacterized protein n=1 Tax=Daldinia eschscholtzii TaxID=292717 RepID=A0AAX6MUW3_9PEZI
MTPSTYTGLTVSVRSTTGHYPPALSDFHSRLSLLQTSLTSDGYYVAEVICHACRLDDEQSANESWIWSANTNQKMQTSDVHAKLQLHTAYVQSDDVLNGAPLNVTSDRSSSVKQTTGKNENPAPSAWIISHAVLMMGSFLVLYPIGILAVAMGKRYSFLVHVSVQPFATGCVLLGVILGLTQSGFLRHVKGLRESAGPWNYRVGNIRSIATPDSPWSQTPSNFREDSRPDGIPTLP